MPPPPNLTSTSSGNRDDFVMGLVGIIIIVLFLVGWAWHSGGFSEHDGPVHCVQEDGFMGENVITCEPY